MKNLVKYTCIFCIFISWDSGWTTIDPRQNEWQLTEYIWNFALISQSNQGLNLKPIEYFEQEPQFDRTAYLTIKDGDIVWLKARFVSNFYHEILPIVQHPFVLIISDGDESFPSNCSLNKFEIEGFIANSKIIHIFAQNYDYNGSSNKISHLPIGMDFHTIAYKSKSGGWGEIGTPSQQESCLKKILKTLKPTYLRKKKAFIDFQLSDSMHGEFNRHLQFGEDRHSIFKQLLSTGLIDYSHWMNRSDLWKKKGAYAFSISPHGNGLDCHRTWEDLALGCIVIVKSSTLDPLYEGLPVVIIKDWAEITTENMEKWLNLYSHAFTDPAYRTKLTTNYWLSKIRKITIKHHYINP